MLRTASAGSGRATPPQDEEPVKRPARNTNELAQVRRKRTLENKRQSSVVPRRGLNLNRAVSLRSVASLGGKEEDKILDETPNSPRRRVSRSLNRGVSLRRVVSCGGKAEEEEDTALVTAAAPNRRARQGLNRTASLGSRKDWSLADRDNLNDSTASRTRTRNPPRQRRNGESVRRAQLHRSLSLCKDWALPVPSDDEISLDANEQEEEEQKPRNLLLPEVAGPIQQAFALGPTQIYAAYTRRAQLHRSLSLCKDWALPVPSDDKISLDANKQEEEEQKPRNLLLPEVAGPKQQVFALGPTQIYAAYTA